MADFYLELRSEKPNKRGECAIRLVIAIDGKRSRQKTGYSVEPKYWNGTIGGVGDVIRASHPNAYEWNEALNHRITEAKKLYSTMDRLAGGNVNTGAISKAMGLGDKFYDIAKHYEAKFRKAGKIGTADRYRSQAAVLEKLYPGIKIGQINAAWARSYRELLETEGKAKNTIVSKMRFINSILNKVVAEGLYPYNPMQGVKKGTFKPAEGVRLTPKEIDKLFNYIPVAHWDKMAKLTALFSYYASGARFKDVLIMPKAALYKEDGKIRMKWQPSKTKHTTGVMQDIPVHGRLASIIEQASNNSTTIFGLVDIGLKDAQLQDKQISKAEQEINKQLKLVMLRCGIGKAISFNDMRRTFLKHFQDMSGDIYLTKQTVQHEKVSTTEGYVGIDQQAIDKALKKLYGS